MAINDVAGEWMYHVCDIFREFLGYNFLSGLHTLKPKKIFKKTKNLKTFSSFPALVLRHAKPW